jgi:hypothetical protein
MAGRKLFRQENHARLLPEICRSFRRNNILPVERGCFKRELLRENSLTAPTCFELPDGAIVKIGGSSGKLFTRRKFPQHFPDLNMRWCSAYLKISVFQPLSAIRNAFAE